MSYPRWQAALGIVFAFALAAPALGQMVKQGDPVAPTEHTDFHSPMVINTVIAPVVQPSTWLRLDGTRKPKWKSGDWLSVSEYHDLGRYTCDGLSIRGDDDEKKGTWESGFRMAAHELGGGKTELGFRVSITNPGNVNDKLVTLVFEIVSGDERLAMTSMVIKSPTSWRHKVTNTGGDDETKLVIERTRLMTEPPPTLRITMSTKDY